VAIVTSRIAARCHKRSDVSTPTESGKLPAFGTVVHRFFGFQKGPQDALEEWVQAQPGASSGRLQIAQFGSAQGQAPGDSWLTTLGHNGEQ
jgi:hypothetical protein